MGTSVDLASLESILSGQNPTRDTILFLHKNLPEFEAFLQQKEASWAQGKVAIGLAWTLYNCDSNSIAEGIVIQLLSRDSFMTKVASAFGSILYSRQQVPGSQICQVLDQLCDLQRFAVQRNIRKIKQMNQVSLICEEHFQKTNSKELEMSLYAFKKALLGGPQVKPTNYRQSDIISLEQKETIRGLSHVLRKTNEDLTESYLEANFNLLQEDFMAEIRGELAKAKGEKFSPKTLPSFRDYGKITVADDWTLNQGKIEYILKFDSEKFVQVDWEVSKRLLVGSMVILLDENSCSQVVFTTVSRRDSLKLGQVTLAPWSPKDAHKLTVSKVDFIMLEPYVYFEAYRPVLSALQTIKSVPLKSHIIDGSGTPSLPPYLESRTNISIEALKGKKLKSKPLPSSLDLYKQLMANERGQPPLKTVLFEEFEGYSKVDRLNVSPAQLKAVQMALTQSVALIQGPPGTGKSYVGKIILQLLLENQFDSNPVLIICHTNHALDSFLESMLESTSKVVRVGGRSSSEKLGSHNLQSIKAAMKEHKLRTAKMHASIKQVELEVAEASKNVRVENFESKLVEYQTSQLRLDDLKILEDLMVLEKADVVGMTTTGASKNRRLLSMLRSKIVIVEEAAQVLESHVICALPPSCQQIIMIGDHQQLRPSTTNYFLTRETGLDISLFERLIRGGMPFVTLDEQHRMSPEISCIMQQVFYENLRNHPSVLKHPKVRGIKTRLGLVSHPFREDSLNESKSKVNTFEANFLLHLARYFVECGNQPNKITILTTYIGQMMLIHKVRTALSVDSVLVIQIPSIFQLQRENFKDLSQVFITVVDNYQGEENDIVLLSLVRSNEEGAIGFLSVLGRICVSLSRARNGLFGVGNFKDLSQKSKIWKQVSTFTSQQLELSCDYHLKSTNVSTVEHFESLINRGCSESCGDVLSCGHTCQRPCHVVDRRSHSNEYKCQERCSKLCGEGHPCQKACWERCYPCEYEMAECQVLDCGHPGSKLCPSVKAPKMCKVMIKVSLECGHVVDQECCKSGPTECVGNRCNFKLKCGHPCDLSCHYPGVNHNRKCEFACSSKKTGCRANHACDKKCSEPCEKCTVILTLTLPKCGHQKQVECWEDPDKVFCKEQCPLTLKCGHPCQGKCGEDCLPCHVEVEKKMSCDLHSKKVPCSSEPLICDLDCDAVLPCGHQCPLGCGQKCDPEKCQVMVPGNSATCGHSSMVFCGSKMAKNCQEICGKKLPCNHVCQHKCTDCIEGLVHGSCGQKCEKQLICGHFCQDICGSICSPCKSKCSVQLCNHKKCRSKCEDVCSSSCKVKYSILSHLILI